MAARAPWGPKAAPWGPKKSPKKEGQRKGTIFIDGPSMIIIDGPSMNAFIDGYSLMVSINEYQWISSSLKSSSLKKPWTNHEKQWQNNDKPWQTMTNIWKTTKTIKKRFCNNCTFSSTEFNQNPGDHFVMSAWTSLSIKSMGGTWPGSDSAWIPQSSVENCHWRH